VSFGVFALVFVAGGALLALWVHLRFTRLAPADLRGALLHLGGSFIACQVALPFGSYLVEATGYPSLRVASLFLLSLPALVYALLSLIWVISNLQNSVTGMLR
jgi:hypothetical protein